MFFDDELDASPSSHRTDEALVDQVVPTIDDEPMVELFIAEALAPWHTANPPPDFAHTLHAKLLERATARATNVRSIGISAHHAQLGAEVGVIAPELLPLHVQHAGAHIRQAPTPARRGNRIGLGIPHQWFAVAAAFFLVFIGMSAFASGSQAPYGDSISYQHGSEQTSHPGSSQSPTVKIKLCLADAKEDLRQLNAALTHERGDGAYTAALVALTGDIHDARAVLGTHFFGAFEQYALALQISAAETQASSDLLHTLPALSWTDRLATTAALHSFGVTVPTISKAFFKSTDGHTVLYIVGSGFGRQTKAVVNGNEIGTVIYGSSVEIRVQLDPGFDTSNLKTIGISNPDGTVAEIPIG